MFFNVISGERRMKRREFIAGLGSAVLMCPVAASPQERTIIQISDPEMIGQADQVSLAATPPIEQVRFTALRRGPRLLVTGGVHGDETAAPMAIRRVISEIQNRTHQIVRGSVTFIPLVNPGAYERRRRSVGHNLNRDLRERVISEDYEDYIANVLCPLLREHQILLDLHSYFQGSFPFVLVGPQDNDGDLQPFSHALEEKAFAKHLGIDTLVYGWLDTYRDATNKQRALIERQSQKLNDKIDHRDRARDIGYTLLAKPSVAFGVGTTEYIRRYGGYGVTVECGQNSDPNSTGVAYASIVNALTFLGLIAPAALPSTRVARSLRLMDVYLREDGADRLADENIQTFQRVDKGRALILRGEAVHVSAPEDGYVVFPDRRAPVGAELVYFAIEDPRFMD